MKSNDNPLAISGPAPSPRSRKEEDSAPLIDASDLLRGRKEVALRCGDAIYRLRITRLGKLILNK